MGKFVALFLLVGLAVGLWLGFNPQTHRELVRLWDRTTISHASARPGVFADVRRWDQNVNRWLRSTTKARPAPQPATAYTTTQISAWLQAFWSALQRIWLNFVARIHVATS